MTRMRSPSVMGHLRTLFGAGTLSGLGEGDLLERFLVERDETAFEEILARHGPMVLGICRRWLDDSHQVDDAFQAVFLILVRKAGSLRDRNSLSNWLYGVTLRVAHRARANTRAGAAASATTPRFLPWRRQQRIYTPDHETLLILDRGNSSTSRETTSC